MHATLVPLFFSGSRSPVPVTVRIFSGQLTNEIGGYTQHGHSMGVAFRLR
jgi:hypothetical protein